MQTTTGYDPYDHGVMEDPYPTYERLRHEAPVYRLAGQPTWVLSRYNDVQRALRDPETFSSTGGVSFTHFGGVGSLIGMDAPDHTRLGRILSAAFTPRAIAGLEPVVARMAAEVLTGIAGRSRLEVVAALQHRCRPR